MMSRVAGMKHALQHRTVDDQVRHVEQLAGFGVRKKECARVLLGVGGGRTGALRTKMI